MKSVLPSILVTAVIVAAVIAWFANQRASQPSEAERVQEAMLDLQADERRKAERAEELMQMVLPAPESCDGLTTGFLFAICESEPDDFVSWPDWTQIANGAEQRCVLDSFHQTNAHAADIRGETYEPEPPENNRVTRFVSDLCTAALWTDGIDWGDKEASASDLVSGYYADRATSRVTPAQSY